MVIEWLKIQVPADLREQYIQADAEIWTPFLAQYPGFVGKEVWISPDRADEVVLMIRWASLEAWKAIPADDLQRVEQEFSRHLPGEYPMVEEAQYQVRKFPNPINPIPTSDA